MGVRGKQKQAVSSRVREFRAPAGSSVRCVLYVLRWGVKREDRQAGRQAGRQASVV